MNWETFYERFFDWSSSTQISRVSSLASFGPSSEVAEIAQELTNEKAASRLIRKAVAAGVRFSPEEICALADCCDAAAMELLLETAQPPLTREQLEELEGIAEEDALRAAAARSRAPLFEEEDPEGPIMEKAPPQKLGLLTALGLLLGVGALGGKGKQRGGCDGDCAHCPPHYGYRYGRWYYGHHHVHGCERGGNGGL